MTVLISRREHPRVTADGVSLLDSIAPIRGPPGRPRHRPGKLHADKAYDQPALRTEIRHRGITVRIARKGIEASHRLGRHRWIVEACLSWLLRNRRLIRRYDRKPEHFQAFANLASALLAYRRLRKATN
ncbi:transposase [Jidongwangia harbinensis]|uniref:transposase n=1 Tax=Jidongwangia harbinensis TaxID=2878561 RepID=UPI003556B4A7